MSDLQRRKQQSAGVFARRRHRAWHCGIGLSVIGLMLGQASAQSSESLQSWGETMDHALVKFLPKDPPGLTVEPVPVFSAYSNDFVGYKGPQAIARRYPTYVVHQTWFFDDPEHDRKVAAAEAESKAKQDAYPQKLEEFRRAHAADRAAAEQAYQIEHAQAKKRWDEYMAKVQELTKAGKIDQLNKLGDAPKYPGPFVYAPEEAFNQAYNAEQQELTQRARSFRRSVEIQIYTNRTPASSSGHHPKPIGTLAGRPLYREDEGNLGGGPEAEFHNLAILVGPADLEVSQPPSTAFAVKAIAVWALIATRPDTAAADEARVRKVLETVDYEGLAKLLMP